MDRTGEYSINQSQLRLPKEGISKKMGSSRGTQFNLIPALLLYLALVSCATTSPTQTEYDELQSQYEESQRSIETLEEEKAGIAADLEAIRAALADGQSSEEILASQLSEKEEELSRAQSEIEQLKEVIAELNRLQSIRFNPSLGTSSENSQDYQPPEETTITRSRPQITVPSNINYDSVIFASFTPLPSRYERQTLEGLPLNQYLDLDSNDRTFLISNQNYEQEASAYLMIIQDWQGTLSLQLILQQVQNTSENPSPISFAEIYFPWSEPYPIPGPQRIERIQDSGKRIDRLYFEISPSVYEIITQSIDNRGVSIYLVGSAGRGQQIEIDEGNARNFVTMLQAFQTLGGRL